ncbi:MAG: chemotaxis protein CheW [Gammaproteobacteria bacterium]|nr:MAG: chemotaxis protein CheW [Gammaproteobacteria bacterium]
MSTSQTEITEPASTDPATYEHGTDGAGSQYLTFMLGGEHYAVDTLRVQEIKGWTPVTCIPHTPDYIRGVLNLRGTIVPILDLRMRFCLEKAEYTPLTVTIVLSVRTGEGERVIGVVVDAVSDVLNVDARDIKPTPDFGSAVNTEFVSGLAAAGEQMVIVLDIDRMLTMEEIEMIAAIEAQQE